MGHTVGGLAQDQAIDTCPCAPCFHRRPTNTSLVAGSNGNRYWGSSASALPGLDQAHEHREDNWKPHWPDPTKLLCILEVQTLSPYPTKLPQLSDLRETQENMCLCQTPAVASSNGSCSRNSCASALRTGGCAEQIRRASAGNPARSSALRGPALTAPYARRPATISGARVACHARTP